MSYGSVDSQNAILMLEDGVFFIGTFFGTQKKQCGEVIFNTAMTGYQEVFSDPSYKGQIVTMTYPHLGNYGINTSDFESERPWMEGIVVREYNRTYSNWRAVESLENFMQRFGVVGLSGIDTQALTTHIRDHGAMRGIIAPASTDKKTLLAEVKAYPTMEGRDLVPEVTCHKPYFFTTKQHTVSPHYRVIVCDYGVKLNILRMLEQRQCEVIVVPATYSAEKILNYHPDGVVLSNGPGDPYVVTYAVRVVQELIAKKIPLFGICLGHQLLGVAFGGKTYKLPFGHHGINHPVKNLQTGAIEITSQNHGFCVDMKTLPKDVMLTHVNLNDQTCEGLQHKTRPIFSVQYHPEAAPGPHDSQYVFDSFIQSMMGKKIN